MRWQARKLFVSSLDGMIITDVTESGKEASAIL